MTTLDACNNLGFGSPIKISTAHMQGIDQLKYLISEIIPNKNNHISLMMQKNYPLQLLVKQTLVNQLY